MSKTISKDSENLIEIKKSKFIGYSFYFESVDDANKCLTDIKKLHKKATHVCFAYSIGNMVKASDDGEPQGTAGLPILECIKKQNLENVLCIVVRYFGGIKLGAGGLVRAYSDTASSVLKESGVSDLIFVDEYKFQIDYGKENIIGSIKSNQDTLSVDISYDEKINVDVKIKKGKSLGYDAKLISTQLVRLNI